MSAVGRDGKHVAGNVKHFRAHPQFSAGSVCALRLADSYRHGSAYGQGINPQPSSKADIQTVLLDIGDQLVLR